MTDPAKEKITTGVFEVRYAAEKALAALASVREFISEKTLAGLEQIASTWEDASNFEAEYQKWKAAKEAK